jgi:hypothetical protein
MTTECEVRLEESLFSLTVKFDADHVTAGELIKKISRLLRKANVSNASISGAVSETISGTVAIEKPSAVAA